MTKESILAILDRKLATAKLDLARAMQRNDWTGEKLARKEIEVLESVRKEVSNDSHP
jgi:hypothetical protein